MEAIREIVDMNFVVTFEPLPADDPPQRRPDISLARRLLSWSPRVGLRDGLHRTVHYFEGELLERAPASRAVRGAAAASVGAK